VRDVAVALGITEAAALQRSPAVASTSPMV